jgi:branched-chain amino acid transport system substrate-binding protein
MSKIYAASALPESDPQRAVLVRFVADYEAYAKQPPSSFAGHAWDALEIVTEALTRVPEGLSLEEQRSRLRDEIEATKGLVGIDGIFTLSPQDHVGLRVEDMVMMRINDGKWAYIPRDQW